MSYIGDPTLVIIDWSPDGHGSVTPFFNPMYRLLEDHQLNDGVIPAGSIITSGSDVPSNWIPTLAVEPLNSSAATAYYNAGPRDLSQGTTNDRSVFPGSNLIPFTPVPQPKTYWQQVRGSRAFQLTGLGSGFPPRN